MNCYIRALLLLCITLQLLLHVQCQDALLNNKLHQQFTHPLSTKIQTNYHDIIHLLNTKLNVTQHRYHAITADTTNDPIAYLIHFKHLSTTQLHTCLNHTNYISVHYVPYNSCLVVPVNNTANSTLLHKQCMLQPYINTFIPYTSEHKYNQNLISAIQQRMTQHKDKIQLRVVVYNALIEHNNNMLQHAQSELQLAMYNIDNSITVRKSTHNVLTITIPSTLLATQQQIQHIIDTIVQPQYIEYCELKSIFHTQNMHAVTQIQSGRSSGQYIDATVYQHNITGYNQLISVGDTGVAYNMCYFSDSQHSVPINTTNYDHRKIVAYYPVRGGMYDLVDGHGTHTANSIAGSVENPNTDPIKSILSHYDGIAYNAKLVVFNLNDGISETRIKPPSNIYTQFYQKSFDTGAYITSNSWGSHSDTYIHESAETDRFVYNNPTFLPLFAAGNYGYKGWNSIVAPSNAKNVLAIGATRNYPFVEYVDTDTAICQAQYDPFIDASLLAHQLSPITSKGATFDQRIKPEILIPGDRIVSARSSGNSSDTQCNTCDGSLMVDEGTSMSCAVAAGTTALVRQYYTDGYLTTGTANSDDSIIPSSALLRATLIHSAVNDIVSLDRNEAKYLSTSLTDNNPINLYKKYQPNNLSGWGRVVLNNVLAFDDSTFDLYVSDNQTLQNMQFDTYCFNVTNTLYNVRTTLSWIDPPATLTSTHLLINNLDLIAVNVNSTAMYYGNHWLDSNNIMYTDITNNNEQITIDKQLLSIGDIISIHVKGTHIVTDEQLYSIVMTGNMDMINSEYCQTITCPNACSNNGICNTDNTCECNAGYSGVDCSIEAADVIMCDTEQYNLTNSNWHYYKIVSNNVIDSVSGIDTTVRVTVTANTGDIMLFASYHTLPTLSDYDGVTHNKVDIQTIDFTLGTDAIWYIGVYAHCCTDSSYSINACLIDTNTDQCMCDVQQTQFSVNAVALQNNVIINTDYVNANGHDFSKAHSSDGHIYGVYNN